LLRLLSWIPLKVLYRLADGIGYLASLMPTDTRRITLINLRLVFPTMTESATRELALQSIRQTIKGFLELGHIWHNSLDRVQAMIKDVYGLELVKQARESGRGIIFAAPHLGNWEVLGVFIGQIGPMTTLYKPPKIKGLERLIVASRSRPGAELVPTDRHGVIRLSKTLQQGGMTGILPDQQPNKDGGVFAPFFGIQALTMTLLPKLAVKTDATVIFAYAQRRPDGDGFDIVFTPADSDIYHADPVISATAMNKSVERCVLAAPSQYQWEYKRFRSRPDDDPAPLY
jgi:KDO2-lipid IV(A) lauroyltransferase